MNDQIVDYVEIVRDENNKYRVRGRSNNGEIVWTSEQYDSFGWAQKIARDSGKEVRPYVSGEPVEEATPETEGETESTETQE